MLFLVGGAYCLFSICGSYAAEANSVKQPFNAESQLKLLDPFYKQHLVAGGVLIVGSEKVTQYAMRETAYLAKKVLANRPDVLKKFGETRMAYVCVMAYSEMQNDLPECRGMELWWNYRARGLAGRPVSCGEENLLGYPGDPWAGENIFIHEFAHGFQDIIGSIDEDFSERYRTIYTKTKKSGHIRGYAMQNDSREFWAEGVQAWFNCNGTVRPKCGGGQSSFEVVGPKGEHVCHIATREQLKTHLPEYAKLLDDSFRQNEWTYVPVAKRLDEPHLRGYDPAKAPTFRFQPEAIKAFEVFQRAEAERKAKEQRQNEQEANASANRVPEIGTPPESFFKKVKQRHRDAARKFYTKHIGINGLPVVAATDRRHTDPLARRQRRAVV